MMKKNRRLQQPLPQPQPQPRLQRGRENHQQQKMKRWLEKELDGESIIKRIRRRALLMDAQTWSSKEECASSTVQSSNDAAMKDAQIKLRREECASSTGQRSNDAAV